MKGSKKKLTKEEVLYSMDSGVPYTVKSVCDEVDVSRWTVRRRLRALVRDGDVNKKQHSERRETYWIPIQGDE